MEAQEAEEEGMQWQPGVASLLCQRPCPWPPARRDGPWQRRRFGTVGGGSVDQAAKKVNREKPRRGSSPAIFIGAGEKCHLELLQSAHGE